MQAQVNCDLFNPNQVMEGLTSPPLPEWFVSLKSLHHIKQVNIREWIDEKWRLEEGGFQGVDFCHSPSASVRI